jgi:hypothetical protein
VSFNAMAEKIGENITRFFLSTAYQPVKFLPDFIPMAKN